MTKSDEVWLGIDVGTQSVRAIAVTGLGEVLARGVRLLESQRAGARHEQRPEDWWQAVVGACREAMAGLHGRVVSGVAVDSTSGTICLMNGQGRALTAGLMHDDNRAIREAGRVNEVGSDVWATLGYRMQPSWALPKVVWMLREERDVMMGRGKVSEGMKVAHQTDFINRRLVGREVATDTSSSLKMGYDLIEEEWPRDVFERLGVAGELLPEVVRSGSVIGTVCKEAADETGIVEGARVIAGMTDSCAAQIGAGALSVGSWNVVLGTTLAFKGVTSELVRDPVGVMYSHRAPDGGWLPGGASGMGAGVLRMYFPEGDLDMLSRQAAEREPSSVLAYPLASRGERFPFSEPNAERFLLGEPADDADLFAALLQGVAYSERLSFDYLDMLGAPTDGVVSLTGGGAQNWYWCQLRADVLGRSVRIPEYAEAALGMAILAARSSGGRTLSEVANEMSRTREVIEPRPDHVGRFQEPYVRLIDELERRGWLPADVARYTRMR